LCGRYEERLSETPEEEFEAMGSDAPPACADTRSHRNDADKRSIQHIPIDPICPRRFNGGNLFTETRKIGRKNRSGNNIFMSHSHIKMTVTHFAAKRVTVICLI
jgi:hypothetical protein